MKIETKNYLPADAILLTGDRTKADGANLNQTAGPGYSVFIDGKLVACGGIRIVGVGEAWTIIDKQAFAKYKKTILKVAKKELEKMEREGELFQVFATSEISDNFLEHLGFVKQNNIFVKEQ